MGAGPVSDATGSVGKGRVKKKCLMCEGSAPRLPPERASSVHGEWECLDCGFRWKNDGVTLYYVGIVGAYMSWIPVPIGTLLAFDKKCVSSAWQNGMITRKS